MSKFLKVLIAISFFTSPVSAGTLGLGRVATSDEVAAWNTDIRPDGVGLPVGHGSVENGEVIFSEKCASCHGDFGEAVGRWPVLAGGHGTLSDARPVKTVGSYWPYLSTVYDYVYRAMPFGNAGSLSVDETYAIVAYIMYVNDTVDDEEFVLSNENFLNLEQGNANGFYMDDRDKIEYPKFISDVCMSDCKEEVKITARAAVVDVTPEETAAAVAKAKIQLAKQVKADTPVTPSLDTNLVATGKKIFKKCKSCHKVGEGAKNGVGPHLNGIFGRAAASLDDFKYSKAMKTEANAGLVWDEAKLRTFLKKPKAMIKKTKMSFNGLKKEAQLDAIIAYLKSVSQ